jgi:hypothetical protein
MDSTSFKYIPVCQEHLRKFFKQHDFLKRAHSGEFRQEIESIRKKKAFVDHKGNACTWTDLLFLIDDNFTQGHHLHQVALAHRLRTDNGTICGSGLWDPKAMMISRLFFDVNYREFRTKGGRAPVCNLCERGDMIPPNKRSYSPKYSPDWPLWKRIWRWLIWLPFRVMIRL